MSAVSLLASAEALTPASGGAASPGDQDGGFSELLSSLAAALGGAAPGERPDATKVSTPELPALVQANEAPALQDPPNIPGKPVRRTGDAEVNTAPDDMSQQPLPTILGEMPTFSQPPVVEVAGLPFVSALANPRHLLARGAEVSTIETGAGSSKDEKAASLAWTVQQALAAVAAIAAPAASPAASGAAAALPPAGPRPAGKSPVENLPAITAMQTAALSEADAAEAQAKRQAFSPDHRATDEKLVSTGNQAPGSNATSLPLDPQILTAALAQAKPASATPHPSAPVGLAAGSSELDLHQLDALVRDIAAVSGTNSRAAFSLTADQLGPIEVRLHTSDAGVAITIRTHDDQSHATVTQAQQQLTDDMRANGLKVVATNVMLSGGDRQRQDRPNVPAALPIEVAAPEADPPSSLNEPRPDGRYA